jgi:four helix bundle protein
MDEDKGKGDPLRVLDAARQFGQLVAEMTQRLSRRAPSGLRGQLAESAQSVSALLAEGFGRGTDKEKAHYSRMANGSLEESQDYLRKCVNLHLIDRKMFFRLWNLSLAISRMIRSLVEYYDERTDEK